MTPRLIQPDDILFFRDAIPMSAGQGSGAGCRLPFPSTLHEAFRASLLRASGEVASGKSVEGRPRAATRNGNWHGSRHDGKTFIATKSFRSLRTLGPLPWHQERHLLLPIPLDVALDPSGQLVRLQLWRSPKESAPNRAVATANFQPLCLPTATTPPDKKAQLQGWWDVSQFHAYLTGSTEKSNPGFSPIPSSKLWSAEHRVGVQINPESAASESGQLYAGSYLRPDKDTRFMVWAEIADPAGSQGAEAASRKRERDHLHRLEWLLLGGEFRLAQLKAYPTSDPLASLAIPPTPPQTDGPVLLKWVLVTPAIFSHGSLPGWCLDSLKDRPAGPLAPGRVCLPLPGRAQLVSWCLGKPRTVSGFDTVEGRAKPTQLAVPEGGVFYFLCENQSTAKALAQELHWKPRSDFYGEKGCGYGLVSFALKMHPTSMDLHDLANSCFQP